MVDYLMFKEEIDVKALKELIANKVIYFSNISSNEKSSNVTINIEGGDELE